MTRTERNNIFQLPDGNYAMYAYGAPVNWQDADGSWHPINPTLVSDALGRLENTSGPVKFSFAALAGTESLFRASGDGWSAGFTLEGMLVGTPGLADGHKIRYPGILNGIDLEYEVGRTSVRKFVVL
ncbi:MAG TPA: hypothetical protein VGL92_08700, partial [Acidimicrobiia bacterium]